MQKRIALRSAFTAFVSGLLGFGSYVEAQNPSALDAADGSPQEVVKVDADGDVGVNVGSAESTLHVNGLDNNGVESALRLDSGAHTLLADGNEIDGMSGLYINNNTTQNLMMVTGGGNVGISSSSPASKLVVTRNGFSGHQDWTVAIDSKTSDASSAMLHLRNASNSTAFYARGDGRVGIGTRFPSASLDVAGEMVVRGGLDLEQNRISDVADPLASQDVATKAYVDAAVAAIAQSSGVSSYGYANQVPDFNHPHGLAYVEICITGSGVYSDYHADGYESTRGGNCLPGDVGFVIEVDDRPYATWQGAVQECIESRMRLPEPYEFQSACVHASLAGLQDLTDDWEWASNSTSIHYRSEDSSYRIIAPVWGYQGCTKGGGGSVANTHGFYSTISFRCVK